MLMDRNKSDINIFLMKYNIIYLEENMPINMLSFSFYISLKELTSNLVFLFRDSLFKYSMYVKEY